MPIHFSRVMVVTYGIVWLYMAIRGTQIYFWLPCSPISPHVQGSGRGRGAKIFFSLVIITKLVQNVNRMSES